MKVLYTSEVAGNKIMAAFTAPFFPLLENGRLAKMTQSSSRVHGVLAGEHTTFIHLHTWLFLVPSLVESLKRNSADFGAGFFGFF